MAGRPRSLPRRSGRGRARLTGLERVAGSISIIAVSRGSRSPLDDWTAEILTRAQRFARIDLARIPPSRERRAKDRLERESAALLTRLERAGTVVALDSRGVASDSVRFADRLESWRRAGAPTFVVGGPDGLGDATRERADALLSFGPMTLPHELALAVLAEQLYRALSADVGHPYGRH